MNNFKIFITAIIIAPMLFVNAFSQYSPYNFLRVQASARAAALAGNFVAMPNDVSAMVFNPATLYTVEEKPIAFTFIKHVLDINSGMATYIREFEDIGKFAANVSFMNYGSFIEADRLGNKIGTFGANDLSISVAYTNELDSNLYYGAALKYIIVNIDNYTSSALAVDVGLMYRFPDGRTNAGVSILHAGTQLTHNNPVSEDLPLDVRAGINTRLRGLPLLVNFTLHHLSDDTDGFFKRFESFALGGELYLGKYIMLRLGYDNLLRRLTSPSSDRKLSGFSGGVGLKLTNFNFDYGIAFQSPAATLHRFSIAMEID